ncbi:hypothetical protein DVH24_014737, partial [Malus domestica]
SGSNVGGVGGVFRDEAGSYAGGFVRQIPSASCSTMVEFLAVHEEICWAMEMNLDRIIVECDSLQVCYVHRSTNVAAHGMAKLAMSFPNDFCWFEEPSNQIVEALVDVV